MLVAATALCLVPLTACGGDGQRGEDRGEREAALVESINHQLELRPGVDNVRAIIVRVHGKDVIAQYDDVPASRHWDMGWGTVAVVATLVGIAIDEGRIPGLEATLGQLLPDHAKDMSPAVERVTLRQVLTMTAGFTGTPDDRVAAYMNLADPVGTILRAARPTPAHRFAYSSQGAHVLAAVVAETTGMPVEDYARRTLFDPLGIDSGHEEFAWPTDSQGLNLGWTSLRLTPEDVARIGQLYVNGGTWQGQRVVSADWVRESTRVQVHNVAHPSDNFSGYGGYGYGWWLIESDDSPAFFVADLSGQLLEVLPTHSLAVVVCSESVPGDSGVTPDAMTFLVNDVVGPAFSPNQR
jgi:CubicO group peptidase (beta-lactamase class C family)